MNAQVELLDDEFTDRSKADLQKALQALNEVKGLGWHLSMKEVFDGLQQGARTQ